MKSLRQKDDFYPTPPEATKALLAVEQFAPHVWEPAAGDGAICKVLIDSDYMPIASDLNDYGYGCDSGIDYLMTTERPCETLVTNPPYRLADKFILHAINLAVRKHAWLVRLPFLEGSKRYDMLFKHYPPRWIWVFSKRLTIWRGDEEATGSGTTAYCWLVWENHNTMPPKVGWL